MSNENLRSVTITVDMSDLRSALMFELNRIGESVSMEITWGGVLSEDGVAGVSRIHQIFFPEEDLEKAMVLPGKIILRARDIMIDAWAGLSTQKEPSAEKLLEVERLLYRYKSEVWFAQKKGVNIFDLI